MDRFASVLGAPRVGLDVDQIADAIWLAQFVTAEDRVMQGSERLDPEEPCPPPQADPPTDLDATSSGSEPKPAPAAPEPARGQVDIARAPLVGDSVADAVRFRSPAASALARQLEVARAVRPLGWRTPRPGAWRLLEELTADRIARTGLWLAELAPDTEPALDLVVVVDASPRLRVWRRVTHELIDVLRSSGGFRMTTTWTLAGDDPELVLRSVGGGIQRGPHHLVGPGQSTAMLVISDFAGALWKTGAGLAGVRLWSQRTMMALVSLVPQRSWGRTLLGTLPATRLSSSRRGRPSASLRSEAAVVARAVPVPVVSLDPASLGTWARLVAGDAQARSRGVLALSDTSPAAHARYAAAAMHAEGGSDIEDMLSALHLVSLSTCAAEAPRDARERVERFCETHRPEVVELAAALISAPLELSVMLVVQRAVAPCTGTLELAEIIDSGLLEIEPAQPGDDEVRFRIADDVRDHLSPLASIGGHLRVLEVVGAYLRDHLGSSIDFEALVVDPSRPVGPIADKDRRFARMFVAELRRLGIDTSALAHLEPPAPQVAPALGREPLDAFILEYDRVCGEEPSALRTTKLDALVEQAVLSAGDASADDARSFWDRGTPGARAVALAICISRPGVAPIEIIVEGIDHPRSIHEQLTALWTLSCVVDDRHPLDADPAIAALVRYLRSKDGSREGRTAVAKRVLRRYLERCALPAALEAKLDVVEQWLGGGMQATAGVCMAFIGGAPASRWRHGELAEALGGELAVQGWEVVAAAGRELGSRTIRGAAREGGVAQLAPEGGEAMLDHADCVIVIEGDAVTASEWKLARARKLPVLALAFTGGVAESVATEADRGLSRWGVPPELRSPLRAASATGGSARLIARVAKVVMAQRSFVLPFSRASLLKVGALVTRTFGVEEITSLAQQVVRDLPQEVSFQQPLSDVAHDVVAQCAEQGVLDRLLFAMLHRRPDRILEITRELRVYPSTNGIAIDRYLRRFPTVDKESWARECWEVGSCVCEVRIDGRGVGTGFLVGPDAVLTSYHAIGARVLHAPDAGARIAFVFDRIPVLGSVCRGVSVSPADTAWQLAASPPARGELSDFDHCEPTDDKLDFVLIRLGRTVRVGRRHPRALSWLGDRVEISRFQTIAVPHYPKRGALALALSDSRDDKLSNNGTRIRYTVDARRGSSGAPVFDAATWELLALHQRTTRDGRQQGIPIARIAQHPAVQRYLAAQSG